MLCLLENEGVRLMVGEFGLLDEQDDNILKPDKVTFISRISQLLSSIPDKVRLRASSALSSQYPSFVFQ